jgi:predicted RNA-binding Zn-ribbon protein involved in translation (DUF1610 family)
MKAISGMSEKTCPFCAETIRAEAIRCRHCGSDLTGDASQRPRSTGSTGPAAIACPTCNVALIPTQVRRFASAGGCVGAVLIVIGIICCLTVVGFVGGLIFMAIGILVSAIGGKKTVMVCPSCGKRGITISE